MARPERIGLVLAGGGARGAYEAGALSVLLPLLAERGERPTVLVGTSVGAINASYLAASRHLEAPVGASGGISRWRDVTKSRVVRPLLPWQVPITAARYAGELLSLPGVRLPSLLDPSPLADNIRDWIDFDQIARNVAPGEVDAIALVATAAATGRTVVFAAGGELPSHRSHAVEYVRARITADHVRASAAIPILFPAIEVHEPEEAAGWYFDGGTRLNTPIKPALDIGVERMVVVQTDSHGLRDMADGGVTP